MRYYNAWVEHLTDDKIIAELDFSESEEEMEEYVPAWQAAKGFDDSSVLINSSLQSADGLGATLMGRIGASRAAGQGKKRVSRERFYSDGSALSPGKEGSGSEHSSAKMTANSPELKTSEARDLKRYLR